MMRLLAAIAHALLLLLPFLYSTHASPSGRRELQSPAVRRADKPSQSQIDTANGMFPGIDWSYTAQQGGCDSGQFAVLVESTRMALELMKFSGEDLRVAQDTTGFNRYFMKSQDWYQWRIWEFANQKYFSVYKFPTTTPKKNLRQYKTVYYCSQPDWSSGCEKANRPPAYTPDTKPNGSRDPTYPYSNSVVFCPRFWTSEFRYVNDITRVPGRALANIDDLHSYEHVLIHEWFHNRDTDVGEYHVLDLKADYGDGQRNIYGSYACQHFAWVHVIRNGINEIAFQTMENADSFAWMISYNWYKGLYGWRDDGSLPPNSQNKNRKRQDEDPEETSDPNADLPIDPDAVQDDTLSDTGSPDGLPESTTYNRDDCPNCLVTQGGCIAVPECRYPQDDGTVDPACTHCTCDVSKTDNDPSTTDLSLSDDKCAGWAGKLPDGYVWPISTPTPTVAPPTPTPTPTPFTDFNCNCGESGCSADSAGCCANGSCACHCGESGCASDDPSCCASGTCHFGAMRMF
ncbi:hypothetical protein BDV96DRAFT_639619 [Lophiotrema nucula]|uniref:Uncharacterized protein n=1 Tax=Lophiotrema nucula TaxID=690887 RepID=A0A6A5ZXP4_9PLEO|nr:hypothetical protein BDV96DRAFT_639619 [Lophiotrema nucula]